MHAPDGFLNAGTAVATGAISAGAVGAALRAAREELADRQVPLAGISAAFVFAAQMINFPVAAGTTGHLLGGALAAILLGPSVGALVVTVVVVVQALLFADGGLTALGYNVLNMALVTSFGGYAVFRGVKRLLPSDATSVSAAAAIGAGASVVLSSMAFSLEWLFGATAPVAFDKVFGAMVGVHLLIGIGEAVITGLAIRAVLAARPDLVAGVWDVERLRLREHSRLGARTFLIAGALLAFTLAAVGSQFSVSAPDGLERVAEDTGFAIEADPALGDSPFADYAVRGLEDEGLSLAVAGIAGVAITLAVGGGVFAAASRRSERDRTPPRSTVG